LDAGHGGSEPGAVSGSIREADLNLELTLILGNILEANGFNVLYTRTSNTDLSIKERVDFANNKGADLFLSIHHNSFGDSSVRGVETLYSTSEQSKNTNAVKMSRILAERITNNIAANVNFKNRGHKIRNDLPVIRDTKMPAVLIEAGFMSNKVLMASIKSA
jgi:N-acetylmuramoyl-L-alanine amidase